jgi:hypothetical protein
MFLICIWAKYVWKYCTYKMFTQGSIIVYYQILHKYTSQTYPSSHLYTALIFCRMFIHIMEVCMSTRFWFSSNILKLKLISYLFGLSAFRGALLLHCEPNYFVVPAPIRTLLSSGRIIFGSGFENCPEFGCELVVEETGVTRWVICQPSYYSVRIA